MSREIKFRAWDKKYECYVNVESIDFDFHGNIDSVWVDCEEHHHDHAVLNTDEVILEQYTGLKDKSGKEIYEGDIMEFGIAGAESRGVVGYEEDFGSYETYTSEGYIVTSLFTSRGKIIGNIHENPELLETEK